MLFFLKKSKLKQKPLPIFKSIINGSGFFVILLCDQKLFCDYVPQKVR